MTQEYSVDPSPESWEHLTDPVIFTDPIRYKIDPTKITTIEDIAKIIDLMGITMTDQIPQFDEVKHMLTKIE